MGNARRSMHMISAGFKKIYLKTRASLCTGFLLKHVTRV